MENLSVEDISHFVNHFHRWEQGLGFKYQGLVESLTPDQMASKKEAIRSLLHSGKKFKKALFIAHWNSLLPHFLLRHQVVQAGVGVELDANWVEFSHRMNNAYNWEAFVGDIQVAVDFSAYDLVVNTACEHMDFNWFQKLHSNTYFLLQSTNKVHPDHINTVPGLEAFLAILPNSEIQTKSVLKLSDGERYTIFGRKI